MHKISQLIAIGFIVLISGCATMPDEMALDSKVYSAQNAGLVLGALVQGGPWGTWIDFREVNTGKTYGWGTKDYYSAWLPAGTYDVDELGSRQGVMGPYSKPLRFTVVNGRINYLGEMTYGCPLSAQPVATYGVEYCGLLALATCSVSNPDVAICLADRQEQTVRTFLKQHPQFSGLSVVRSVMSVPE